MRREFEITTYRILYVSRSRNRNQFNARRCISGAKSICEQLIAHGAPANRPIAVVQEATLPTQKVLVSTLEKLDADLNAQPLQSPSLMVIGDVANLAPSLAWFNPIGK